MSYKKAISYEDFMGLPPEERRTHANYFHTNYPDCCPVILSLKHAGKPVPLKTCKYLYSHSDSSSDTPIRWVNNNKCCADISLGSRRASLLQKT